MPLLFPRNSLWDNNWKKEEKENDVPDGKECRFALTEFVIYSN